MGYAVRMPCSPCTLTLPLMVGLAVGMNSSAGWGLLAGVVALIINLGLDRVRGNPGCSLVSRTGRASAHPSLAQPVADHGIRVPDSVGGKVGAHRD